MMKIEDMFRDRFSIIAAGPGGVDRLRELILELAVHLVAKSDSPSTKYVPLCECGEWLGGLTPSKQRADYWDDESIPWFSPKDMKQIELEDAQDHITSRALEETSLKLLPSGSVLFVVRGMILAHTFPVAVTTRPATINQDMRAIIPKAEISDRYLVTVLRGYERKILELVKTSTHGTKKLNSPELKQWIIPVPPLDEQHRIVKKVDHLMALCDDLERWQRAEREGRRRLRMASLAALEEAATAEESEQAWAHVAGEFGRLVDSLEDVVELRKSIFQLAIKGRLGTRSETDEPANILLRHLIEQNPARKERQECAKKEDFSSLPKLPYGWVWTYVHCVGAVRLGRQRAPEHHYGPFMRPYLRVANVYEDRIDTSDVLELNFTPGEYETYRLEYGDVLLNEGQSRELVGRPAIYRDEVPGACFQNTLVRFRPFNPILSGYALTVFRAYLHSGRFQKKSQQTVNIAHLSAGRFAAMKFPLPPLAEQQRIVDKVHGMMTFCDTLEAGIRARDAALEAFAEAACRAVLDGPALATSPAAEAVTRKGQQRLPI
ncbi:MAG: restriction endonuclease subunit S [Methanospirillum sp.]